MVDEQYIKMCEKAIEIQDSYLSRIPAADDIFAGKIWLPRLEQLVSMIPDWNEFAPVDHMGFIYDEFSEEGFDCGSNQYSQSFKTLVELLLAYVMKKKYEKVWDADKEEWKKYEFVYDAVLGVWVSPLVYDAPRKRWVKRQK